MSRDSSHVGLDNDVRIYTVIDNSYGLCVKMWHRLQMEVQYKYKYNSVERSYVVFGCLDKMVQSSVVNWVETWITNKNANTNTSTNKNANSIQNKYNSVLKG